MLALIVLVLLPLMGLNGYVVQMKFMQGFTADAKGSDKFIHQRLALVYLQQLICSWLALRKWSYPIESNSGHNLVDLTEKGKTRKNHVTCPPWRIRGKDVPKGEKAKASDDKAKTTKPVSAAAKPKVETKPSIDEENDIDDEIDSEEDDSEDEDELEAEFEELKVVELEEQLLQPVTNAHPAAANVPSGRQQTRPTPHPKQAEMNELIAIQAEMAL